LAGLGIEPLVGRRKGAAVVFLLVRFLFDKRIENEHGWVLRTWCFWGVWGLLYTNGSVLCTLKFPGLGIPFYKWFGATHLAKCEM
jgi:hypothetical protein